MLVLGQLQFQNAEAKTLYGSDMAQTVAVFTMIAVAIAGFAIFLGLQARESAAVKQG
jgi:hypothetical protein